MSKAVERMFGLYVVDSIVSSCTNKSSQQGTWEELLITLVVVQCGPFYFFKLIDEVGKHLVDCCNLGKMATSLKRSQMGQKIRAVKSIM